MSTEPRMSMELASSNTFTIKVSYTIVPTVRPIIVVTPYKICLAYNEAKLLIKKTKDDKVVD